MASRPTAAEIKRLLDRMEPEVAEAFREAMRGITSNIRMGALEDALARADLESALRAIGAGNAAYVPFTEAVRQAYNQGGMFYAGQAPKSINFGFDVNNPRAQTWARETSGELVTILQNEKRDVVQSAIREVVGDGVTAGKNPKTMALDLAGRMDRTKGIRVGGRIQLTNQQSQYVANAASELRQNTNQSISNYLKRSRRDRRFDGIVKKALENNQPLTQADINRITTRYSDRLLQHRAEMIARTETNRAFQQAADESLRQLVDEGHVRRDQIRRIWDATMDGNTRPTHAAANGQAVGLDEPFQVGMATLRYPLDPRGPAEETVACRCFVRQDIDYLAEGLDAD